MSTGDGVLAPNVGDGDREDPGEGERLLSRRPAGRALALGPSCAGGTINRVGSSRIGESAM